MSAIEIPTEYFYSYRTYKSNDKVTSLKGIEYLTSLKSINLQGDFLQIDSIDLTRNAQLTYLNLHLDSATKVHGLDLTGNPQLEYLYLDGASFKDGATIDLMDWSSLKYLHLSADGIDSIDLTRTDSLKHLELYKYYSDIAEEGTFLTSLQLSANSNTSLAYFSGSGLSITTLDLSNMTSLIYAGIGGDVELATLNLSNSTNLKRAYVDSLADTASVDLTGLTIDESGENGIRVRLTFHDDTQLTVTLDNCKDATSIVGLTDTTNTFDPVTGLPVQGQSGSATLRDNVTLNCPTSSWS